MSTRLPLYLAALWTMLAIGCGGDPEKRACMGGATSSSLVSSAALFRLEIYAPSAVCSGSGVAPGSGVPLVSHVYAKDDPDPKNRQRAGVVYGPQCEIARQDTGTAGRFYDEGRRGMWLAEIKPEAKAAFQDDGWNHYRIVVQGNRYRSWVNDVAASDLTDDVDKSGLIGLQVHGIAKGEGPYQVRWRNIRIKELKSGK